MTTTPLYLTTALDYTSGPAHLGHAFEKVGADAFARYHRLSGHPTLLLAGTDEHGVKVERTAAAAGLSPAAWVDTTSATIRALWDTLGISYTHFVRTTDAEHAAGVHALIERLHAAGALSEGTYEGWYCVGCEAYVAESDLVAGQCPTHPTRTIEWLAQRDWFFALEPYRPALRALVSTPGFIRPAHRQAETLGLLDAPLPALSISRSLVAWGLPWPGDPDRVVYVWVDALTRYLTATGFPATTANPTRPPWPADCHIIGRDILRFHAIVWPALLLAADLPLPRSLWVHGFVHVSGGGRFSSSAANAPDLADLVARHGPDSLRHTLLGDVPWDGDGTFTVDALDRHHRALADGLGNLASRVTALLTRHRDGVVPTASATSTPHPLDTAFANTLSLYDSAFAAGRLHRALAAVDALTATANAHVSHTRPWELARAPEHATALDVELSALTRTLARLSRLYEPFLPHTAPILWRRLGGPATRPQIQDLTTLTTAGWHVAPAAPPLCPKGTLPTSTSGAATSAP